MKVLPVLSILFIHIIRNHDHWLQGNTVRIPHGFYKIVAWCERTCGQPLPAVSIIYWICDNHVRGKCYLLFQVTIYLQANTCNYYNGYIGDPFNINQVRQVHINGHLQFNVQHRAICLQVHYAP